MDQHSAPVGTDDVYAALPRALELATDYLQGLPHRPVDANTSYDEVVDALSAPLPEEGTNAVAVVERLLARAQEAGASDLHVAPTPAGYDLRLRLDGVLHRAAQLPREADFERGLRMDNSECRFATFATRVISVDTVRL